MIKVTHNIRLDNGAVEDKRSEIRDYFLKTYALYEELFSHIVDEKAYYEKADPLRHPLIFYFGHTATFFTNKLTLANLFQGRINEHLEAIFAVGVDEMTWDDLDETNYTWPSVAETKAYRDKVKAAVLDIIDTTPFTLPITWDSPLWIIMMGIEHERIHLETSSVLLRQVPLEYLKPLSGWPISTEHRYAPENELLPVPSGTVMSNKNKKDPFYGWDNEYGYHEADIPSFKASKFLVSNKEFLAFVEDKGYARDSYWEEAGKRWKQFAKVTHPAFWVPSEEGYKLRFLAQVVDFMHDHPVEVNYHEAKAYCNWLSEQKGKKITLPTEDEWYRLVDFCDVKDAHSDAKTDANHNLEHFASTVPVSTFNHNGFYDVIGNVWQWTQTPIYPYEGFEVHPLYDDFSTPTFDTRHNLIKGGSWISTGNEILLSARYAFRRHFYQHAGFRYVESAYKEQVGENIYESDDLVSQYIEFGWGKEALGVANYPATCAALATSYMKDKPTRRALDIGCAIGRSSFELARSFDEVTGLDFTARFIATASKMKESKQLRFTHPIEGDIMAYESVTLRDFDLEETAPKVTFWQADACNLKPIYTGYDLIFAGNLLDRLYNPQKFLLDIPHRLNDGGILILTSPYTWLEEFTPKHKWLGGYVKEGKNVATLDALKAILENSFNFLEARDVPFVIKETARKHQYTIAQMSVWEKKL